MAWTSSDPPRPKALSPSPYSVETPHAAAVPGEGVPRRHPLVGDGALFATYDEHIHTLYDMFRDSVARHGDRRYLGTRSHVDGAYGAFAWQTYAQVARRIDRFASGLVHVGLRRDDKVGLYAINCPEWVISEHACYTMSLITVPIYDTLGTEAIVYIFNQTELHTVVATADKAISLCRIRAQIPLLRRIVLMDEMTNELISLAEATQVELHLFASVERSGADSPVAHDPPCASDVFTICYTSGSSGTPKGVVLAHAALVAVGSGIKAMCDHDYLIDLNAQDVYLSYLPLAHVLERTLLNILAAVGACIGFYHGDTLKLADDIQELKPTFFASVPRLFNKIYDRVMAAIKEKGLPAQLLFNLAYQSKQRRLREGKLDHWLWEERLGGRVRGMLSGSAPLSDTVMDFLRVCFAAQVFEGYGQTETCAASCLTQKYDYTPGTVGVPTPCNEIKLLDVPEMDYYSTNKPLAQGEICLRGPNCFREYYRDPEKTREALDGDGWVHSGDIGAWDALGRLRIIDRKKNLFKLSQGEYVAPEKIENALGACGLVEQVFVHGHSLKSALVAVVVPDKAALVAWAKTEAFFPPDSTPGLAALCANDTLKAAFVAEVAAYAKSSTSLKGFEIPRAVYLDPEPFSVDNDLLTSTFKLKRYHAIKRYAAQLEQMYTKID